MSPILEIENPSVEIIKDLESLNELGCSFFLQANEAYETMMISSELRWLNIRLKDATILKKQKDAHIHLDDIIKHYGENVPKLNMQILLNRNPLKMRDNKHIIKLIEAGADVRYRKTNNPIRISLRGNLLFVSYSENVEKTVNAGIKYLSRNFSDPVIKQFSLYFAEKFNKARKISVKNNELYFCNKWYSHFYQSTQEITAKEIIILLIGAVLGGLITLLTTLLTTLNY